MQTEGVAQKRNNKVVTLLLSSRYQDVFALLVRSSCDKPETRCYHLVTRLMTPTELVTSCSNKTNTRLFVTVAIPAWSVVINLLTTCYTWRGIRLVGTTCCESVVRCRPCYKMITTCYRLVNNWEQTVLTHLVDKLWDCKLWDKLWELKALQNAGLSK
jgi:hypothetical protein